MDAVALRPTLATMRRVAKVGHRSSSQEVGHRSSSQEINVLYSASLGWRLDEGGGEGDLFAVALEPEEKFFGGKCAAEEVALREVAVVRTQEIELPEGFDAFGDDLESERVAHLDGLAHHVSVGFAGLEVLDKRAVDLELGGGDGAELAHHGESGSEVVDGELDLFEAEAGKDVERAGELLDEAALCDLEDDAVGGDSVLAGE